MSDATTLTLITVVSFVVGVLLTCPTYLLELLRAVRARRCAHRSERQRIEQSRKEANALRNFILGNATTPEVKP